jgi:pimeloyl-ACP methyl ester carboxylesterase
VREEVLFAGADERLAGTIACPDGTDPVPGLVLIGGSGPADRHNGGLFDALRDHLVGAGVAVLAYDKRGVAGSTGAWSTATVDELAGDAAAAVAVLGAHPRVAADAVGVLGHSEGGWVALRLATRLAAPAHLIVNSCPVVSFVDAEVFALTTAGAEASLARTICRQLTAATRAGAEPSQGQRILAGYAHEPWYGTAVGDFHPDAQSWAQLRAWADYDPHDDLVRLTTPTLAVFGENDPLVPVAASIARYRQTAAAAARAQRIVTFPAADHRLRTANAHFAVGYLTLLSVWCHAPKPPDAAPPA